MSDNESLEPFFNDKASEENGLKRDIRTVVKNPIDASTKAINCIDYPHHEIHSGSHYYIEGYLSLANEAKYYVKLVTPNNTKWAHFLWDIEATGVLITTFDETASGGMTGGSGVTPLNNDRNSNNSSGLVITSGVSIADAYVTRISNQKFGVASIPSKPVGGGDVRTNEIILKQNTTYLRTFESGSGDNIVSFRASWYEHTNVS